MSKRLKNRAGWIKIEGEEEESSHLDKLKFSTNKLLLKDELNKLKRDRIVKTDVIYKVKNEDIEFKIGEVTEKTVLEYKKNLEKLF